VSITDVARRAKVSKGTVSTSLNRPELVAEATQARIQDAIEDLGYVRDGRRAQRAWHWRRSGFAARVFQPAVTGWYPKKGPQPARPVPLMAEPWPGVPIRDQRAVSGAELAWLPIAKGLMPHGLRHSHKTVMTELRIHEVFSHERMGHELGGIGARYMHVTDAMRRELCELLTARWEASLDARLVLCSTSSVPALNELLRGRLRQQDAGRFDSRPTEFPRSEVSVLRARPPKRLRPVQMMSGD
jgi:hypothetical protein